MNIEKSYDCEKFDFEQIADMNDLIEKITDTLELSKRLFVVTITYRDKDKVHTPSQPENTYTFGCCIKDIKTTIRISYDFFDISDEKKDTFLLKIFKQIICQMKRKLLPHLINGNPIIKIKYFCK